MVDRLWGVLYNVIMDQSVNRENDSLFSENHEQGIIVDQEILDGVCFAIAGAALLGGSATILASTDVIEVTSNLVKLAYIGGGFIGFITYVLRRYR